MAKDAKKPTPTPKNDDVAPLTGDQLRSLMADHLLEIRRLAAEMPPEPVAGAGGNNAFDDIDAPPPTGQMRTVRDSPEAKKALVSIDAAVRELTTAETIFNMAEYIAGRLGLTAGFGG